MSIMTIESILETSQSRELTPFESQRLALLRMVVEELRHYADCRCADGRDARGDGNESLADALFADRDAFDRAADILQWG